MDLFPGLANVWAFLVNGVSDGCRFHGWYRALDDLNFQPYFYPTGRYSVPGRGEQGEIEDMRKLLVGLLESIVDYQVSVLDDEDVAGNLLLAAKLQPTLRSTAASIPQYLGIDVNLLNQVMYDGDARQLRAQLTDARVIKFARAMHCFACLFPQEADINLATAYEGYEGYEGEAAWGTPLNAGILNDLLEPDDDEEDGVYKFKVQQRRRDYPIGHPLWTPSFLHQNGGNAMQIE